MNKYIRNITFVSALSLWAMSTTSCTDYLDKAPASDINPTDAYTNFRSFQGFTEELYNCVPVITGNTSHNSWNWGEDVYWFQMTLVRLLIALTKVTIGHGIRANMAG